MSKQKIYDTKILTVLSCFGGVLIAGLLIFLAIEYRALNKTAQQVLELKEDYRSYVMALKHAIREKTRENGKDEKSDVKKNSIIEENEGDFLFLPTAKGFVDSEYPQTDFLVVNREPAHLKAGALQHAKRYNLDQVLAKMFDTQEWETAQKKRDTVGKVKKRKKKRQVEGAAVRPVTFEEPVGVSVGERDFLFSWPVERSKFWISSPFGPRRIGKRAWKFHYGVDMAACRGTPVQAAASGIVIESNLHKGFGNCIVIMHNHKYKTRYAHLHARYVKLGEKVTRGKVIGSVGSTGNVRSRGNDASHLHFEVYSFGRRINPMSVLI